MRAVAMADWKAALMGAQKADLSAAHSAEWSVEPRVVLTAGLRAGWMVLSAAVRSVGLTVVTKAGKSVVRQAANWVDLRAACWAVGKADSTAAHWG